MLVTRGTGYVAGWIIKTLLEECIFVHDAVRDPSKKEKLAHLRELESKNTGKLKFFKADLLLKGSYFEAMQDCTVVFHTASPFTSKITNPQKDLVDPALLGTRYVLQSVNETPTVTRVVLTSSAVAMYGDNKDIESAPNHTLTEGQWNTTSGVEHQPYL